MNNKKWKKFEKLSGDCYRSMGMDEESNESWDQAFEVLKEIVAAVRNDQPECAAELYLLDEITDYEYDVQGWLEDYLDILDIRDSKEGLLKVCDELLGMFCWEEDTPSDIKFLKASSLSALGRKEESVEFCKEWREEEPDDLVAVTASVYALLDIRDMETAEKLIKQHIHEDTECTDENDILFTAAATYYKIAGNKKEMKRLDKARDEYDKQISQFFLEFGENMDDDFMWDEGDEDDDFMWDEDELPFS